MQLILANILFKQTATQNMYRLLCGQQINKMTWPLWQGTSIYFSQSFKGTAHFITYQTITKPLSLSFPRRKKKLFVLHFRHDTSFELVCLSLRFNYTLSYLTLAFPWLALAKHHWLVSFLCNKPLLFLQNVNLDATPPPSSHLHSWCTRTLWLCSLRSVSVQNMDWSEITPKQASPFMSLREQDGVHWTTSPLLPLTAPNVW